MRLSYAIAPILILIFFSPPASYTASPAHVANRADGLQSSPHTYVTFLQKPLDSSPNPWVLYPTATAVWVAGLSTGTPPISHLRKYHNDTSKPIVTLPIV